MNDFTKEELKSILESMDQYYLEHFGQKLQQKIESMIDNYCEHPEARRHAYIVAGCMPLTAGGEKVNYCDVCKAVWRSDK